MFGRKKKTETATKKGIKSMDAVVTGAILGGVVASIYGVKKIRDAKQDDENETPEETASTQNEETDKKPSILARLFSKKQ